MGRSGERGERRRWREEKAKGREKRRGEDVEKRERRGKGREMEERGGGETKGEREKW